MNRSVLLGLLSVGSASALAQQAVKPRPLGAVQSATKEIVGSVTLARQLPNGSVIVNDGVKRRLLLLDPTLQTFAVIADSTSGSSNGYGQRAGALIPYVADSTLYFDATAGSFLVIDPVGKVTRVMSPPRPSDNNYLVSTAFGFPGFDSKGRMVYRSRYPQPPQQMKDGSIQSAPAIDTAPILRVNLDTRKADTIGAVKLARTVSSSFTMPGGGTMNMQNQVPLPLIDDWALLSDGSIAILRGRDYHVDWIRPNGTKASTDRIPYEWKRLSDDEKLAMVDSITKARANMQSAGGPGGGRGGQTFSFGDGGGMRTIVMGDGGGGGGAGVERMAATSAQASQAAAAVVGSAPASAAAPGKPGDATSKPASGDARSAAPAASAAGVGDKVNAMMGGLPPGFGMPPAPSAGDLPDYLPPFSTSAARPDADANLWVRTTAPGSAPGNLVYDVINNKGQLTDRVDVPRGMSIVGFGHGGVVYLTRRDTDGLHLVRASIH